MKSSAVARFRAKLKSGEPLYGLSVTFDAPAVSDIATGMGLDWLLLNASLLAPAELAEHARAANRSHTVVLFRLDAAHESAVEQALTLGADGIVAAASHGLSHHTLPRSPEIPPLFLPFLQPDRDAAIFTTLLHSHEVDGFFLEPASAPADDRFLAEIQAAGKQAGAVVPDEKQLHSLRQIGFRILGLGTDEDILSAELHRAVAFSQTAPKAHH